MDAISDKKYLPEDNPFDNIIYICGDGKYFMYVNYKKNFIKSKSKDLKTPKPTKKKQSKR